LYLTFKQNVYRDVRFSYLRDSLYLFFCISQIMYLRNVIIRFRSQIVSHKLNILTLFYISNDIYSKEIDKFSENRKFLNQVRGIEYDM